MISYRHFRAGGFHLQSQARDVVAICNGVWPEEWVRDEPRLNQEPFQILNDNEEDKVWWCGPNRTLVPFSVRDAWWSMMGQRATQNWTKYVWFKGCVPKHAFCVWLAIQKRLPTQDRINSWKTEPPDLACVFCNQCPDSHDHLFFLCSFSTGVWRNIKRQVELFGFSERWEDIIGLFQNRRGPTKMMHLLAIHGTVYHLWMERNRRIFRQQHKTVDQLCKDICDGVMMREAWRNRLKNTNND